MEQPTSDELLPSGWPPASNGALLSALALGNEVPSVASP